MSITASCAASMAAGSTPIRILLALEASWMAGYGALLPVLNELFMIDTIGTTGFGAMESVANTIGLVATPILGRYSDLNGRKAGVTLGAALGILSCSLFLLAHVLPRFGSPVTISIILILAGRIVDQFSGGLEPTLRAYMADCGAAEHAADNPKGATVDELIGYYMGQLQGSYGLGFSLGTVGGGLLGEAFGVLPPLVFSLATTMAALLLTLGLPHRAVVTPATTADTASISAWELLKEAALNRTVAVLLLLRFLTGIGFMVYITTDQRMLKERFDVGPEICELARLSMKPKPTACRPPCTVEPPCTGLLDVCCPYSHVSAAPPPCYWALADGYYMFTTGLCFAATNALLVPWAVQRFHQRSLLICSLGLLSVARFIQASATTFAVAYVGTAGAAVGGGATGCLIASLVALHTPHDRCIGPAGMCMFHVE